MARVKHADATNEKGFRANTIGAATNDLKRAYTDAIFLAQVNQNTKLKEALENCLGEIGEIDMKALEAICDFQGKDGEPVGESFVEKCQEVADALGIEIIDTYTDGRGDDIFEDDGTLHVTVGVHRVAFDVSNNQNLSAKEQNKNSMAVVGGLGLKITKQALV